MPNSKLRNKAIIVLGMHRSGTSALTGLLAHLGANPGNNLMPAGVDNPKGFWEHAGIVAIHDELLSKLNSSWSDEFPLPDEWWRSPAVEPFQASLRETLLNDFSDVPLWVIKDPRLCILLPLWQEILHDLQVEPRFILILRHPAEVAESLRQRNNFPAEKAYSLWLKHTLAAEQLTRGCERFILGYKDLLLNPDAAIQSLQGMLGKLGENISKNRSDVSATLDNSLKHHHARDDDAIASSGIASIAWQAYRDGLNAHTAGQAFQRHRVEYAEYLRKNASALQRIHALENEIFSLKKQLASATEASNSSQRELQRIKKTASWRVTKPLRLIANTGKGAYQLLKGKAAREK